MAAILPAALPAFASSAGTAAAATAAGSAIGPVTAAASGAGALGGVTGASLFAGAQGLLSGTSLTTGLNLLSGISSIQSGILGQEADNFRAEQAELTARQEVIRGAEESNRIRRAMLRDLASANATFAARGVAIGAGGTPEQAEIESREAGTRDIARELFNADIRSRQALARSSQFRASGQSKLFSGLLSGLQPFGKFI